ncbi:glutathione S-transferase [Novosphingobium marinum]|uniref:Glutathione S-transferase n=1 Tax=Novosphingobium marinum TaxID=1514948 RepID=A0A7Y9XWN1_9SPHN|nr:glutathione S-transferase family protein [Novosphingobium marinum]NYH94438.1 glutathione S-transferase [Novosphingobium marinum]GGC22355.1 glutathione S-transferase [Novosphingobium marinum]
MPISREAELEITAFDWVPDLARGHVRDIRPRWACEEIGLPYRERLIDVRDKPDWYFAEQPWGQVPVIREGDTRVFESGATLVHIGEKDPHLLPRENPARGAVMSWLFAAYNSIEPSLIEMFLVDFVNAEEEWAKLRRPSMIEMLGARLDGLVAGLGDREWFAGQFSIADIAMTTMLRTLEHTDLLQRRPTLAAYRDRAMARPAFAQAMADQIAAFDRTAQKTEA